MERDEAHQFTELEFATALRIIAGASDAHRWAQELKHPRATDDHGPPWQLSPDVLDLLSLVSNDCARRVAAILGLTPDDAKQRRLVAAQRFRYSLDSETK